MTSNVELSTALNFLANNWRGNPELSPSFTAIFNKLKMGNEEDKVNAQLLENYLLYPGSDEALRSTFNLHAALMTKEGRREAGLPPRVKGKSYPSDCVRMDDHVMKVMVNFELGLATSSDVERAVIEYNGPNAVEKTNKRFIEDLRPRAQREAKNQKIFFEAKESGRNLFE